MEEDQKVCVLVSGGADSTVLLLEAMDRYREVFPLYIQNGLRWEPAELFWLRKFLRNLKSPKLRSLKVLDLTLRDLYEGHWSITGVRVPGAKSQDDAVYLPGRNIIFLSKAAVYAALEDIPAIEIGILKNNPFRDGTKRFLKKLSDVLSLGLGKPILIRAPFQGLRKEDVLLRGRRIPMELSFSCVNPKGYEHCGDCNKCVERKKAFFAAGLFDKTKYKKAGI
ncbi:MAG: 7-cyano-7-deazaguanine synthase [Candidatus Omnitrophica bacterium]|nr:7-cyano-7-deazaguanine synthase [Candidatus Omnitrophota bacterium]